MARQQKELKDTLKDSRAADKFMLEEAKRRHITTSLLQNIAGEYGQEIADSLKDLLEAVWNTARTHRDTRSIHDPTDADRAQKLLRRRELALTCLAKNEKKFMRTIMKWPQA